MGIMLELRKAMGVHRRDLAVATGYKEATLIAWEKGLAKPTLAQWTRCTVGIEKLRRAKGA